MIEREHPRVQDAHDLDASPDAPEVDRTWRSQRHRSSCGRWATGRPWRPICGMITSQLCSSRSRYLAHCSSARRVSASRTTSLADAWAPLSTGVQGLTARSRGPSCPSRRRARWSCRRRRRAGASAGPRARRAAIRRRARGVVVAVGRLGGRAGARVAVPGGQRRRGTGRRILRGCAADHVTIRLTAGSRPRPRRSGTPSHPSTCRQRGNPAPPSARRCAANRLRGSTLPAARRCRWSRSRPSARRPRRRAS